MKYSEAKFKTFKGHLIKKGDTLFIGDFIVGNLGSYLIFQEDGNLVHYDVFDSTNKDDAVWSSEFQSPNAHHIILDNDGYLNICDKDSVTLKTVFETKSDAIFIEDYNIVQTPFTERNSRILEQGNPDYKKIGPKYESNKSKKSKETMDTFIDDYKTMDKHLIGNEYTKLKGGIILIGSLLWDDNIKDNDNKREEWRNTFLEMGEAKYIKFPIRYGRKSGDSCMNTYTMVVSNSETYKKHENLGTAMIIPLKPEKSVAEHIYQLALAEGITSKYKNGVELQSHLKIFGGDKKPWGIIGFAINRRGGPDQRYELLEDMKKVWSKQISDYKCYDSYPKDIEIEDFEKDPDGKDRTNRERKYVTEKIPFHSDGRMTFLNDSFWEEESVRNLDFVICTLAYPSPKYISCEDIAKKAAALKDTCEYDQRQYYHNTRQAGIQTLGDDYIYYLLRRLHP